MNANPAFDAFRGHCNARPLLIKIGKCPPPSLSTYLLVERLVLSNSFPDMVSAGGRKVCMSGETTSICRCAFVRSHSPHCVREKGLRTCGDGACARAEVHCSLHRGAPRSLGRSKESR
eukprot:6213719-Pleurochrysis_carterae.AAC.1